MTCQNHYCRFCTTAMKMQNRLPQHETSLLSFSKIISKSELGKEAYYTTIRTKIYPTNTQWGTIPGCVAQSVTCLATDACLTADPGIASSIPARSHTFVEIDHEIISTVILLPSADSFKKGCCQLQAKVCAQITG